MSQRSSRLGPFEHVTLFLSYQRYGFALSALALAAPATVVIVSPTTWWAWVLAALPFFWIGGYAVAILSRFPRKLRLTKIAVRRIARGSFQPREVANCCGDPCFRVVAREILNRAGVAPSERDSLIREFQDEATIASSGMLIFDHDQGTVTRLDGEGRAIGIHSTASTRIETT